MEGTPIVTWFVLGAAILWLTVRSAKIDVIRALRSEGERLRGEVQILRRRVEDAEEAEAKYRAAALDSLQNIEISSDQTTSQLDDLNRSSSRQGHPGPRA